LRRRCLQRLILTLAAAEYPPRGAEIQRLLARLQAGQGGTLGGCRFHVLKSGLWAYREARAVQHLAAGRGEAWDSRWTISGPWPDGAEIRALGADGLALCAGWRDLGLPRGAQLASPALWLGERLIAAPGAGFGPATFRLLPQLEAAQRIISVISH
jgi:tRNA(Ile)-lysidine synthase